jgi:two-component sensor histidine kinase
MFRLQIGGKLIGYTSLWESRRRRDFTAKEIALCQGIAQQAAIAIQNAQLLEQARQDAATKAMLLEEVNHRVKNNLTTIIGLLYAERHYHLNEDSLPQFQEIIQDLTNRVQGLATAHNLLSAAEWSPLSLTELTRQVIASALQGLLFDKQILVEVSASPARVTPQQASNLALIINELTTNTVKHALSTHKASITININHIDGLTLFEFRDSGPGYPLEVLNLERHNVGLYLIQNIVHKGLRGELSLRNDVGAVTLIRFPALIQ